jgi:hypothetical protein
MKKEMSRTSSKDTIKDLNDYLVGFQFAKKKNP